VELDDHDVPWSLASTAESCQVLGLKRVEDYAPKTHVSVDPPRHRLGIVRYASMGTVSDFAGVIISSILLEHAPSSSTSRVLGQWRRL